MDSRLRWSLQVANQPFLQTSSPISARLLPQSMLRGMSRLSSSGSNSPTSRWSPPPSAPSSNPYHECSLIYVLTTRPKRTSMLAPRWKGPFRVCRIPNEYQVTHEDDGLERTVHINHAKPVKFTAPYLPEPVPPAKVPCPPLGYHPAGLARKSIKPRAPPVAPSEAPMARR